MKNVLEIPNYPDYHVSVDTGEVYSFKSGKARKLKPRVDAEGYLSLTLSCGRRGKKKECRIHRLVAMTFLDNPNNYPEVNHKDGNKLNNSAHNLEWCTKQFNLQHALDTGLRKLYRGGKVSACKKVKNTNTGIVYNSLREAAEKQSIAYWKFREMMCGIRINTSFCEYV